MAAGRAEFFPPVRLSGQGRLRGVPPRFMVQPPRALAWERAALGRRQVVRQSILIPPCGGSNPPAPANQSDNWRLCSHKSHKLPPIAGFCKLAARLQTPKSPNSEAKLPRVSVECLKYSRF